MSGKSLRAFLPQQLFEIGDGLRQALSQLNPRRPGEMLLRRANIGTALLGIVMRERPIDDLGRGSRERDHQLGKLPDRRQRINATVGGTDNIPITAKSAILAQKKALCE